ncbi:DUF4330 family protein [Natrinema halophilum]|uniref:DUF4330 family protein n=1 Tax=Natrinema halophilum TaxID=1699371 RepID=A0A7D5GS24_9EURY|nr:DUF4330 family protein [Natrinema halophilum]QLG48929.1 DUF4330 domain-containing protein [Natrinema halophilum]
MPLIDDEGNLFGVVNVIDALAVALLLAVFVAGIAFVGVLGSDGEPETKYATIDLGGQPDYVVERVSEGDTITVDGSSNNFTITDVYVTPSNGKAIRNRTQVRVRAEIHGETVQLEDQEEPQFQFAGEPLQVGNDMRVATNNYSATGRVTSLDPKGKTLTTAETPVLLETTISERTADRIAAGDTVTVGSQTVATVTNVQLYPAGGDQFRAFVGAELRTLQRGSAPMYAGRKVTVESQISMSPDGYDLTAAVVRRGADQEIGDLTTIDAEIKLENIPPEVADEFQTGMTESIRSETLVTIESVESEPAEIVLESEDGDIYLREHPKNKDVTLSVTLRTRQTDTGLRFYGDSLQTGDTVVLDFGTTRAAGTVTNIG